MADVPVNESYPQPFAEYRTADRTDMRQSPAEESHGAPRPVNEIRWFE
jgi:hypothetical protein